MNKWGLIRIFSIALLGIILPSLVMAQGMILPNGRTQFIGPAGTPLVGGTVSFFIPGTSSPKNTWMDPALSQANSNPVILDSNGSASIWGSGNYREVVQDSLGNTIFDAQTNQPAGAVDIQNGVYLWGGTSTGAANAYAITVSPVPSLYVPGQNFRFIANFTNTGAVSLNVNSLGAVQTTKLGSATPLIAGDIANGEVVQVVYDGARFQLLSVPNSLLTNVGTGLTISGSSALIDPSFFPGFISGLQLASITSPTTLTINSGVSVSDDNTTLMKLASSFNKNITANWTVGNNNGCLDTGAVAGATWYHVWEIERTDTLVVDVLCSLSASSPTMPLNYAKKRRLFAVKTESTPAVIPIIQHDDEFWWATPPVLDLNGNPSTANRTLTTLNIPPGLILQAIMNVNVQVGSGVASSNQTLILTDPATADVAPGVLTSPLGTINVQIVLNQADNIGGQARIWTNNSGQIGVRGTQTNAVQIQTLGWMDRRGKG